MKKIMTTALLMLSVSTLQAEGLSEINTALKVSTLGFGIDASTPINNTFSGRLNINGATYSDEQTSDGNKYEGTLDLFTAGILVDAYPFENNFRISSGVYYNGNGFTGTVTPSLTQTVELNGIIYGASDITKVNTDVTFNKVAPYLGIGWGNDARDKGWGFTFDLGLLYHGKGEATLTAEGIAAGVLTQVNDDLEKEEQNINDDLEDNQFYPVVSLGVNYTF